MNGKKAFNQRAEYYVKSRPDYPTAVLTTLREQFALDEMAIIVDVGSGTGKLAHLFLANGNRVFGVEPSAEMRAAAEETLAGFERFHSISGSAEATTLPDDSVDWITAGQSAHWFKVKQAAVEFRRILRPDGWVALVWNTRDEHDAATAAFSRLLKTFPGESSPRRRTNAAERERKILLGRGPYAYEFIHDQQLDFDTLRALALSKSYAPLPGEPAYEPLVGGVRRLFKQYERDGRLRLVYRTDLFVGRPPVDPAGRA